MTHKFEFNAEVFEMKYNKQIVGLLKAIFFIAISIALILFSYVISTPTGNLVSVVCFYIGIACFFVGIFIGIANFRSTEDDRKE